MAKTKIEWAERTWNPITGCTKISAGCKNCYAERMSKRLAGRYGYDKDNPFKVTFHPNRLEEPLRWRKPQMVFVCSMGDLFHEDVPEDWINRVFAVMALCPQHTFLVLTKRPERMKMFIEDYYAYESPSGDEQGVHTQANVWLGVTAENQEMADKRIPILLQTPAAKRFVSVEPMLGVVDLTQTHTDSNAITLNALTGIPYDWDYEQWIPEDDIGSKLDWVICGGETGHGARPMHPDWARGLKDQCVNAGVPFFFKSWGDYCYVDQMPRDTYAKLDAKANLAGHGDYEKPWKVGKKRAGRLLDGREWNERPEV